MSIYNTNSAARLYTTWTSLAASSPVQPKRANYEHMRLVSYAQSRAKTQHSSLNKQRISKTTQQKFIYANTLDVSKTCTSKTLIPGGMQHFSYKSGKKKLKTRDGSTRREKNTCCERFKGNVGLHTSTLQSHRQSDTNRSHKNTRTEIISCDNKILCNEEEYKYTSLVLQRGVCVWEREMFCPQKKCGSVSLRGCALRTSLHNKSQWGKGRNEGREGEEHRRWTKKKKRTLFEKKNL